VSPQFLGKEYSCTWYTSSLALPSFSPLPLQAFPVLSDGWVFHSNQETSFSHPPIYPSPELPRDVASSIEAEDPTVEPPGAERPLWQYEMTQLSPPMQGGNYSLRILVVG
jgi:hypothetical protein